MKNVILDLKGSGLYKMPICLIVKDLPTFRTDKSSLLVVPLLKFFNSLLKGLEVVNFAVDLIRINEN